MAEEKKEAPKSFTHDLAWFLGVLFIMWVLWFATGGVQRYEKDKPFIKPLSPNTPIETYGPTQN